MIYFKILFTTLLAVGVTACGSGLKSNSPPSTQPKAEETTILPTDIPGEPMEKQADADVINVKAILEGNNTWTFHVTVVHPDTGWDDYVDGWDVVTLDGTVLKANPSDPFTRLLLHPHENEQPFTRSQSGISVPDDVNQLIVKAHDIIDGYGGQEIKVDLEKESGPGFTVEK